MQTSAWDDAIRGDHVELHHAAIEIHLFEHLERRIKPAARCGAMCLIIRDLGGYLGGCQCMLGAHAAASREDEHVSLYTGRLDKLHVAIRM